MLKRENIWIALVVLAAVLVFLNALPGEFVYDDNRQIVLNPLIQDGTLFTQAVTSDVWAFKGGGLYTASNYWRPVFTAWCILNFLLFGLDSTAWHLLNILLHAGVCLVAFLLLRRWEISERLAAAILLVFAVHPVHTESVAWISGSPDILFALFFLLSLLFADRSADDALKESRTRNSILAILFYCLALGSKEVALACFPIFFVVIDRRSGQNAFASAFLSFDNWKKATPYVAAAIAYFAVRLKVLGALSFPVETSPGKLAAILTAPSILLFYIRQMVFPLWLGPNHALRPVETVGLWSFIVPLVASILILGGFAFVAKESRVRRIGSALFLLPLLPAFAITVFPSEQIVHDRYLYLPLLGFLIVTFTFIADEVTKRVSPKSENYLLIGAAAIAAVLAIQTFSYNRAWLSDLSLWRHAVTIDDNSAANWRELGAELAARGDVARASEAYRRSLAIRSDPLALVGSSRLAIARGELDSAVRDLEAVTSRPPEGITAYSLYQAYEALAIAYQEKKNFAEAERRLREARGRLPIYNAALTEKIAVILYQQDRKGEALAELEKVRSAARTEMLQESKSVFFRLGLLYNELGRKAEAKAALEEFLQATANAGTPVTVEDRRTAVQVLRSLK